MAKSTVFLVLSLSDLLSNTWPHCKEKISADVTYAEHTVVRHLGLDIFRYVSQLLDADTNFDDDFSKLIELGN